MRVKDTTNLATVRRTSDRGRTPDLKLVVVELHGSILRSSRIKGQPGTTTFVLDQFCTTLLLRPTFLLSLEINESDE